MTWSASSGTQHNSVDNELNWYISTFCWRFRWSEKTQCIYAEKGLGKSQSPIKLLHCLPNGGKMNQSRD
uniref:Uncharacterized protein n=1 Tax=Setaria italica TaxID=4555 RepID=K3ZBJ3_SETIT